MNQRAGENHQIQRSRKTAVFLAMAAKAALLGAVKRVSAPEMEARREAARCLKNLVIGSNARKSALLDQGAVNSLTDLLEGETAAAVLIEAIPTLGSLAHGEPKHAVAVCSPGVVTALLKKLSHPDNEVVACSARALRAIFSARGRDDGPADAESVIKKDVVEKLVVLLDANGSTPLSAATILASCCKSNEQKQWILDSGGVEKLLPLLAKRQDVRRLVVALSALGSWTSGSTPMSNKVCAATVTLPNDVEQSLPEYFLALTRDGLPDVKIGAAQCLTNLYRAGVEHPRISAVGQLLPAVLKIVKDDAASGRCPAHGFRIVARLVEDDERLQQIAANFGITEILVKRIGPEVESSVEIRDGALLALAAMASKSETARKAVVKHAQWSHILVGLQDPSAQVRRAATKFVLSISRSVRILRTALVESSLADPLCKMLEDNDLEVRVHAAAAMCNVVMEFSPVKKMAMDLGVIQKLVIGTRAPEGDFRLNCIWGLKNLLFEADSPNASVTKSRVMDAIGWSHLRILINDEAISVQEQALGTLRNLVYGSMADVDNTVRWCGGKVPFYSVLRDKMSGPHDRCREQVLYILCNATASATATSEHKDYIVSQSELLGHVVSSLQHTDPRVTVAALWCIINLAWAESPGAAKRQHVLLNFDILSILRTLLSGLDLDIKDRSKTTLEQFYSCGNVPPNWSAM